MSLGTREKIQNTAERLFAKEGFDRVTLRQIARAADQRNVAAVQYHFGSKKGLLDAIVASHREQLDERREDLLAQHAQADQADQAEELASLLEILIVPLAEKLDSESGRAYLRIQADGLSHTEMRPATRSLSQRIGRQLGAFGNADAPTAKGKTGRTGRTKSHDAKKKEAHHSPLPDRHRENFTILLLFHSLADRARLEEKAKASRADRKAFIESLTRAMSGLLRS